MRAICTAEIAKNTLPSAKKAMRRLYRQTRATPSVG
jgi:hypothetical protein